MEPLAEVTPPLSKRHSRNISHSKILPRRSTKGPLDTDDPLASSTSSLRPSATTQPGPPPPAPPTQPPDKDLSYLLHPSNFHPIPPPFISSNPPPTASTPSALFASAHYYSAALAAAERLARPPPPSNSEVFSLLYIRLASLTKCQLGPLALAEASALGDIASPFYRASAQDPDSSILPWELRVLVLSLQCLQGKELRHGGGAGGGGPGAFYDLGREARVRFRSALNEEEKVLWKTRMGQLAWMTVNALVEEGDMNSALKLTKELRGSNPDDSWGGRTILLFLKAGDVEGARRVIKDVEEELGERKTGFEALISICEGDYVSAVEVLDAHDGKRLLANNLAVTEFYAGNIEHCMQLLDQAIEDGNSTKETIFNLATCYELLMERSVKDRKEDLLARIKSRSREGGLALGPADFKL